MIRQVWKLWVCVFRSAGWAYDRSYDNGSFRPRQLSSIARFCRCMKMPRIVALWNSVNEYLTGFGGGFTTLPPWVRGIDCVRGWVTAKTAIDHPRLIGKQAEVA